MLILRFQSIVCVSLFTTAVCIALLCFDGMTTVDLLAVMYW